MIPLLARLSMCGVGICWEPWKLTSFQPCNIHFIFIKSVGHVLCSERMLLSVCPSPGEGGGMSTFIHLMREQMSAPLDELGGKCPESLLTCHFWAGGKCPRGHMSVPHLQTSYKLSHLSILINPEPPRNNASVQVWSNPSISLQDITSERLISTFFD